MIQRTISLSTSQRHGNCLNIIPQYDFLIWNSRHEYYACILIIQLLDHYHPEKLHLCCRLPLVHCEEIWTAPFFFPQIGIDKLILSTLQESRCESLKHCKVIFMQRGEEGKRKLFVGLVKWEEVPFHWILMCPVVMAPRSHPYSWTFVYMWVCL